MSGDARSGHPSLQDAIYHALALELGGTLVTADRKYVEKRRSLDQMCFWKITCLPIE